jgi:hypothetical protein
MYLVLTIGYCIYARIALEYILIYVILVIRYSYMRLKLTWEVPE